MKHKIRGRLSGDTQFYTQFHSTLYHTFLLIAEHHFHHLPGLSHCQSRYINLSFTLTEHTILRHLPGLSHITATLRESLLVINLTQHCETFLACLAITAAAWEFISHHTSPSVARPSWPVPVSQQVYTLHFLWSWCMYFNILLFSLHSDLSLLSPFI